MLHKTNGIVLRSVKYGETSLVTTIFTALFGLQTYLVRGVRNSKTSQNSAGYFQPGMLLDLVLYNHPLKNMQRISQYQVAYMYETVPENVVKNSIVLFSVELLQRLLPDHPPLPVLFSFAFDYFMRLDKMQISEIANFPLFFIIQCGKILGYELQANNDINSSQQDIIDGEFAGSDQSAKLLMNGPDAIVLNRLLNTNNYELLNEIKISGVVRFRLLEWYISYLQHHTQTLGNIKSVGVLKVILN